MSMAPPAMDDDGDTSSVSSPPQSPQNNHEDETIKVAPRCLGEGVVHHPAASASASSSATPLPGTAPVKPKRTRKPKLDANGNPVLPKPRKKAEPKVKAEGGATTTAPATKRRKKTAPEEKPAVIPAVGGDSRQTTLTGLHSHFLPPGNPASSGPPPPMQQQQSHPPPPPPQQFSSSSLITNTTTSTSTSSDTLMRNSLPPPLLSSTPTPRPFSSGQNYDPIRGQNYDPIRGAIDATSSRPPVLSNGAQPAHASPHINRASPHINRASASPSITSLIDPPSTNTAAVTFNNAQSKVQHPTAMFANLPSSHVTPLPSQQPTPTPQPQAIPIMDGAMDVDSNDHEPPKQPALKAPSKSSSSAPTPKPAKAHSPPSKALIKPGTGTGILSSSNLFGGPSSSSSSSEPKGITIELRISLRPEGGNAINIAQEIAKKYGRDAINPRVAAHRERLLQVAAQANRLENGSADDDMSVDLMSELDGDSNVEMGGVEENEAPRLNKDGKPMRKRKKVEEYDKEDDFIDDTELAWQEQAAVAKDGFFVYSGPLVQPGQNALVESTTAPTRGRGTGRGRGRGRGAAAAAAAAAAASGTTHASLADKTKDSPSASTTGSATKPPVKRTRGGARGGAGAAGGGPGPAKKRRTKAEIELAEREKSLAEQEKRELAERKERDRLAGLTGSGVAPASAFDGGGMGVRVVSVDGVDRAVAPGLVLASQRVGFESSPGRQGNGAQGQGVVRV
ncbi:hypothetical protein TI39_contig591g00002 [Zymoseptoria brevis]|uniref:Hpc2-related domain-containing protein n=1 Tax=Zymoseptoria brevis TaxID=1047168 RepID=A0A0F4GI04_9PEZI|nr:hypothetical protein TI39_contig591g00002 [Zymoseptoria brevis]